MSELIIREATSLNDAEAMRQIRNECRLFMTRNNDEISFEQQRTWWKGINRSTLIPLLCYLPDGSSLNLNIAVGYGIIRLMRSRWWLTGGFMAAYRGRGFGEVLFRYMIERAGLPCWLDVKETNTFAIRLYQKLGFRVVPETIEPRPGVLTMVLEPEI